MRSSSSPSKGVVERVATAESASAIAFGDARSVRWWGICGFGCFCFVIDDARRVAFA